MIGFLGEYEATLDAKGRFLLPVGFKKQLPDKDKEQFVISRGFEKCLSLYPIQSWKPILRISAS
jgi:MraZ protein